MGQRLRRAVFNALVLALPTIACLPAGSAADSRPGSTAVLLEDDPDGLLRHLTGQAGGDGSAESRDVYSGKAAVRIIPTQRFGQVPGWNFRIAESPGPGEYRFVRFAWRADGCDGIMVQFHVETGWSVRYVAGLDVPGWGSKQVAPAPPPQWAVVTRDLFADFGPCAISGIALTAFGGKAGYFDHVYLARTVEDLDRIDATGLRDGPAPVLDDAGLEQLWGDLGGDDAAAAYRAFWTIVAASKQAVPFIRRTCGPAGSPDALAEIGGWIAALDADDFAAREEATRKLGVHIDAAAPLLRKELDGPGGGLESRIRIERLLRAGNANGRRRAVKAVSILEFVGTVEAQSLLEDLSGGAPDDAVAAAAKAVLIRMKTQSVDR